MGQGTPKGERSMERYKNLGGNSGVVAYETSDDAIVVEFASGERYEYDHRIPGRSHIERMKILAENGLGLNFYIGRYVGKSYARKVT